MLLVFALYYSGLLPFVPLRCDVMGVPSGKIDYARVKHNLKGPDWLCRFLAFAIGGDPASVFMAPSLMAHLRRRGMAVQLLPVNRDHTLEVARRIGATAVLTDRPVWLSRVAAEGRLRHLSVPGL